MTVLSVRAVAPRLLIVEPDRLVRSTVSGVCRELELARVHQAATVAVGQQMLQSQAFDLWLVSLAECDVALELIERLRRGGFDTRADVPVAVMATSADAQVVQRLKPLGIRRLLLQPFKIRDVVVTVEALCVAATPHHSDSGSTSTA